MWLRLCRVVNFGFNEGSTMPFYHLMKKIVLSCAAILFLYNTLAYLNSDAIAAQSDTEKESLPKPSSAAQKLYSSAQNDLLQLRVLLKNGRTPNSLGSGFLIGTSNLVVTNYHVISQIALEPEKYLGEYIDTRDQQGTIALLAVDVLHDLAVVRINRRGNGFFNIPEKLLSLTQGQHLYSLGNPLDLGFAISEGAYNGIIKRSFYKQLMFTGPINAGMSGGPSVTVDGGLAGVNVSKRLDGELVSFLVPAQYVQTLLKKVTGQQTPPQDFKKIVGQQLLAHQAVMMDRLFSGPLTIKTLGPYKTPIRESDQMRCWGSSEEKQNKLYTRDYMNCSMESAIYVSDQLRTSQMSINHVFTSSSELGSLRFSKLITNFFQGENFGSHKNRNLTSPACTEQFVNNKHLSLRAVICVRAYRKFAGIYDFAILTSTTDESLMNLQSRLDIKGVSYENGLRVSRIFIESIGRERTP